MCAGPRHREEEEKITHDADAKLEKITQEHPPTCYEYHKVTILGSMAAKLKSYYYCIIRHESNSIIRQGALLSLAVKAPAEALRDFAFLKKELGVVWNF